MIITKLMRANLYLLFPYLDKYTINNWYVYNISYIIDIIQCVINGYTFKQNFIGGPNIIYT